MLFNIVFWNFVIIELRQHQNSEKTKIKQK